MTPDQEERLVAAFERIGEAFDFLAGSVEAIAKTAAEYEQKRFPPKKPPAEATITHIQTDEERLREEQGSSGESLDEWTTLEDEPGPREKAYLDAHPEETRTKKT